MIDLISSSTDVLSRASFSCRSVSQYEPNCLVFEDATSLGFLFAYSDASKLIESWARDSEKVISAHTFPLRRAAQKAWNTYVVLLAHGEVDLAQAAALSAIEEDLTGTRKIARAGMRNFADVQAALISLLPLQSAPSLESIDMAMEIRQRTTELPSRVVEAFLSSADESIVLQVSEESQ